MSLATFEIVRQFAGIHGLVKLFLVFGACYIRKIEHLIQRRKVGHIGRGAYGHFQAAFLGSFHKHAIRPENGIGENLDFDFSVAFSSQPVP